jgi:phospholipid transport system substrate-binding protein
MRFNMRVYDTASWLSFVFLLLGAPFGTARAEESLLPPQQVIQETSDKLQRSLQQKQFKDDFVKATKLVEEIINPHVDFDRVSYMILGKYWKPASPDQRERFKKEFRTLLVRTYTTAFTEYANWTIRYLPLRMDPDDKRVVVHTQILQPGAQPVGVDYRMVKSDGRWKVYDVLIEGISLVQNYRTSFTEEIARSGSLEDFIDHIAQRNSTAMKEPLKEAQPPVKGS